jgi:hypothetical protein
VSRTPPLSKERKPIKKRAFRYALGALETRIKLFTSLRLNALDRLAVKRQVDEIGHLRVLTSEESER